MKVGSLFSGIGGFDLGLERAGMEIAWQVEIDNYATKVLEKHWPNVKRYRDIREVGSGNLEPVDLICGGFPCQDLSVNGRKAGLNGERSGLWYEYARVISELRPKYVLVENVTGLLTGEGGGWFGTVLGDLASLRYDAQWHCIPASSIGANHQRDRVWLLAYPTSLRRRAFEIYNRTTLEHKRISREYCTTSNQEARRLSETDICRENNGISNWVDRLKGLGNAVVPQIPEIIGRMIMEIEKEANDER